MSVLTLGDLYTKLKERFDQWSDDASSFMEREEILFPEQTHLDDIAKDLLTTSHDALTQEALQLIFKSFSSTIHSG